MEHKLLNKQLDAIAARWQKATPGPIDVRRIDQGDGTIAYQLQQSPNAPWPGNDRERIGRRVLTQYDDLDNPDARHDAEFHAKVHEDVPWLLDAIRTQVVRHEQVVAAMQSAINMAKHDADVISLREAELHAMLRTFALPVEPKALAREIKARTTELEAIRASTALPEDSEAFIAMVEGELRRPTRGDDWLVKHVEKLAAIVRGQAARISDLEPEAKAWRDGQEVLRELRERVIPCGHKIEDLIGGEGAVTKCGACLAERCGPANGG